MPKRQVVRYHAEWNPNAGGGAITLRFAPAGFHRWESKNPAEFGVVLQLLSSSENAFVDENGTVSNGIEDIDD